MSDPSLLFVVNGFGLGNSTRSVAVIDAIFERGFKVDVVSFGRGYEFFSDQASVRNVFQTAPLTYGKSSGPGLEGSGVRTGELLRALPQITWSLGKQVQLLRKVLKATRYSAIVTDSDYAVGFLKPWIRIPIFAINNSAEVAGRLGAWSEFPRESRRRLLGQWAVELLDAEWHRRIPDRVLSPSFITASKQLGKKVLIPPIVRASGDQKHFARSADGPKRLLVISGGSGLGWRAEELEPLRNWQGLETQVVGLEGRSSEQLKFLGHQSGVVDLVRSSDFLLLNGGFSSMSEAFVYGKPAIIVPIEGHAEQLLNAKRLSTLGRARVSDRKNWPNDLRVLVAEWTKYFKACSPATDPKLGVEVAVSVITQGLVQD